MNIIFFPQTAAVGPAANFRIYQYISYLEENGIQCTVSPAINASNHTDTYITTNRFKKTYNYALALKKRLSQIPSLSQYDKIIIQKETFPRLIPLFETLAAKKYNNLIFDFDDAIFLNQFSKKYFHNMLAACTHVIVGNQFLYDYAKQYNPNTTIIPTVIDTDRYTYQAKPFPPTTIGWSGSVSTIPYLKKLKAPLRELLEKYPQLQFIVMSNGEKKPFTAADLQIDKERFKFINWHGMSQSEIIEHSRKIDIGLMPLADDQWSQGKCGLKALVYMSLGIPTLCSPTNVNTEIIADGENGFLCSNQEEWIKNIERLLTDKSAFTTMTKNARATVEENYSLKKWAPEFFKIISAPSKKD